MTQPRQLAERCPVCGQVAGYLAKQSPRRQTFRCSECLAQWADWRNNHRRAQSTPAAKTSRRR